MADPVRTTKPETKSPHTYNAEAVNQAISKDKRIKGTEARLIHGLLQGRGPRRDNWRDDAAMAIRECADSVGKLRARMDAQEQPKYTKEVHQLSKEALEKAQEAYRKVFKGGIQSAARKKELDNIEAHVKRVEAHVNKYGYKDA